MWEKRALQFLVSLALGGSLIIPAASASTNATTQSDATVSVVPTDPLFAEPYIDKDEWRNMVPSSFTWSVWQMGHG